MTVRRARRFRRKQHEHQRADRGTQGGTTKAGTQQKAHHNTRQTHARKGPTSGRYGGTAGSTLKKTHENTRGQTRTTRTGTPSSTGSTREQFSSSIGTAPRAPPDAGTHAGTHALPHQPDRHTRWMDVTVDGSTAPFTPRSAARVLEDGRDIGIQYL